MITFKAHQLAAAVLASLSVATAQATTVHLETASASVSQGSQFQVRVVADIDAADAIIGFGFDLSALTGLLFRGFTAGPGFADDPLYLAPLSDADGIRGASGGSLLLGPAVSGVNLLLGVLDFEALGVGTATVGLDADDLAFNFSEGLIPLDPALVNFMPPVSPLAIMVTPRANGLPEPGSLATVALALAAMLGLSRRRAAAGTRPCA